MWNYRVIKSVFSHAECVGIYEVYYNEDGEIVAHSEEPMAPYGDDVDELKCDLKHMMDALDKPILVASEIVFAKPDWRK